jgi:hypothetical protein
MKQARTYKETAAGVAMIDSSTAWRRLLEVRRTASRPVKK